MTDKNEDQPLKTNGKGGEQSAEQSQKKEEIPNQTCCQCIGKCLSIDCCGGDDSILEFGIRKKRSCTDFLCCLLFLAGFVALASIWGVAVEQGNINRLIRPVDYKGQMCGVGAMADKPVGFWPSLNSYTFKMCGANCDVTWNNNIADTSTPNDMEVPYTSKAFNGYCLPDTEATPAGYEAGSEQVSRAVSDLWTAMPIIAGFAGATILVGFIYIFCIRKCLGIIVWTTAVVIVACSACGGYVLYTSADEIVDANAKMAQQVIGGVLAAFAVIFVCLMIFMRERISIAVNVLGVAGKGLGSLPGLLLLPFLTQIVLMGFAVLWIYMTALMFSAAETKKIALDSNMQAVTAGSAVNSYGEDFPTEYTRLDYDSAVSNSFWFNLFMLFWVIQFIMYFMYTVIAGAFSDWYFTRKDENNDRKRGGGADELSNWPVFSSFKRTFVYHLGSIAWASLIIAVIQTVRAFFAYMEKQAGKENVFTKYLMACIQCALWCLECCMDAINKRALIVISITGDSFCVSAQKAFKLIWENLVRIAAMSMFTWIVILVGKVLVTLVPTAAGLWIFKEVYKGEYSGIWAPGIAMFIVNWVIAGSFMTVYETAADTVFMCFLLDEKANKANGNMFAEPELAQIVQKYSKKSEELGGGAHERRAAARKGRKTKEAAGEESNKGVTV